MSLSINNISKPSPPWYHKIKRVVNVGVIPIVITTLKGLWVGDEAQLNKILLIITITLPGILEVIGMLLTDDTEDAPEDLQQKPPTIIQ